MRVHIFCFCFIVLFSLHFVVACDDKSASELSTLDATDTSNDVVDPPLLAQALVGSWSWENITAALCNDNRYTWTFSTGGVVEYTVRSDNGQNPDTGACTTSSNTETGTFSVNTQGVVRLQVGDTVRDWQVAILENMPQYQGEASDPLYKSINNILTTRAFVGSGDGKTFSQTYAGPTMYTDSQDALAVTLTTDAVLAPGACRLSVSTTAQSVSISKGDSNFLDIFSLNCRVEATGLNDWLAVIPTEEIARDPLPSDVSDAERSARSVRDQFWRSNAPVLYYRSGAPNTLIYAYNGCCNDAWMNGD